MRSVIAVRLREVVRFIFYWRLSDRWNHLLLHPRFSREANERNKNCHEGLHVQTYPVMRNSSRSKGVMTFYSDQGHRGIHHFSGMSLAFQFL